MNRRAQAGLEYLMTYGWGLILIATVVTVLLFVVGSHGPMSSGVSFSVSDPTKFLLKGAGLDSQGQAKVVLQNISGGKITVTSYTTTGHFLGGTLNGTNGYSITSSSPLVVQAGGELLLNGIEYVGSGPVDASIAIEYTDQSNLQRNVSVSGNGTVQNPAASPITACGIINSPGKYYLANDIVQPANGTCLNFISSNVILNCDGKTITGQTGSSAGSGIYASTDNLTIANCNVQNFTYGIQIYSSDNSNVINNTVRNNGYYGFYVYGGSGNRIKNNSSDTAVFYCFYIRNSPGNVITGNSAAKCYYGINIYAGSNNNLVSNNSSCGNTIYDISCATALVGVTGTGNTATKINNCSGITGGSNC